MAWAAGDQLQGGKYTIERESTLRLAIAQTAQF